MLTEAEKSILELLAQAWNEYTSLPGYCAHGDVHEFADGIHQAQQIIAVRVARRVNPEVWGGQVRPIEQRSPEPDTTVPDGCAGPITSPGVRRGREFI